VVVEPTTEDSTSDDAVATDQEDEKILQNKVIIDPMTKDNSDESPHGK
jgi:hypothetical protein